MGKRREGKDRGRGGLGREKENGREEKRGKWKGNPENRQKL